MDQALLRIVLLSGVPHLRDIFLKSVEKESVLPNGVSFDSLSSYEPKTNAEVYALFTLFNNLDQVKAHSLLQKLKESDNSFRYIAECEFSDIHKDFFGISNSETSDGQVKMFQDHARVQSAL